MKVRRRKRRKVKGKTKSVAVQVVKKSITAVMISIKMWNMKGIEKNVNWQM